MHLYRLCRPFRLSPRRSLSLLAVSLSLLMSPIARAGGAPAELPDLDTLQNAFESVAAHAAPAVVAISASTTPDDQPTALRQQEMNTDTLAAFLSHTTRMVGAGFFISSDGYILTNDHVIDDAQQLWVTTDNKTVYPAIVVGSDPRSDLAVLKVPATHQPTLAIADTAGLRRGQWSLALGNPFGLSADGQMCLSVGVVSAAHRSLPRLSEKENRSYYDMIQTTAQINPGNSGGPLLDVHGRVIGLNTATVLPQAATGASNGIGFAIVLSPAVMKTVARLQHGDAVDYAYLGVATAAPTDAQRQHWHLRDQQGVIVTHVYADSPAADVLLAEDDLLLAIDGQPIPDTTRFARLITDAPLNRLVRIDLLRDGRPVAVWVTLRRRPSPAQPICRATQRLRWAGMVLANTADGAGLCVCSISADSPFARQGLHEGSLLTAIAGQPVHDLLTLQSIINDTPLEQCAVQQQPGMATADVALDH